MYTYEPLRKGPGLDFRSTFTFSNTGKSASSGTKYSAVSIDMEPEFQYMNPSHPWWVTICTGAVQFFAYFLFIITLPFSAIVCFKMVHQYERIVVYRIGHLLPLKGPGIVLILPCIDRWNKVDLRTKAFNVPPTRVCTSDGGLILIGSVVHFRVQNPLRANNSLKDMNHSIRTMAQSAMSKILSKKLFSEVMSSGSRYNYDIQTEINEVARDWGLEIGRVELSQPVAEVSPPVQQTGFLDKLKSGFGGGGDVMGMTQQLLGFAGAGGLNQQYASMNKVSETSTNIPVVDIEKEAGDLINAAGSVIDEDMLYNVDAAFEIKLTDNGNYYFIDLKIGGGSCGKGRLPVGTPDATLILSFSTLHKLLSGKIGAFSAYNSGNLKLEGDIKTAMRLEELVNHLKI
ncbi:stomatin-like protein 1 [Styela clava]